MPVGSQKLSAFLESIRARKLGAVENSDAARRNVGDFIRDVSGIVRVSKKADLPGIVEEANRHGVSLYPYSCGLNWGYGSRLPVCDGGVLLDLSALKRIVRIDEEHGIATIEPGVTQRQLSEELTSRKSRYYLDVTGSGADTSVLGNALERGIAYGSLRVQQLAGMEILLANGTQFRTGFGGFSNPILSGLYPYGLGPDLNGLFFQSNLGIVTEGELQLALRPENLIGVSVTIADEHLPEFMNRTAELAKTGYLHGIPHVANRERTISTLAPLVADETGKTPAEARGLVNRVIRGDWMLTGAVTGSSAIAHEKLKRVKKAFRSLGTVYTHHGSNGRMKSWLIHRLMTREQKIVIGATESLRGFHHGKPSDAGIRFLMNNGSVDGSAEGFLLCTPLAPLSGKSARRLSQIAQEKADQQRVGFAMTLNLLTSRVLEAVVSVHFARSSQDERTRAHACVHEMTEAFSKEGFYPYRINIDQQQRFSGISPAHASLIQSLKTALDPNGVIAPGRYGP